MKTKTQGSHRAITKNSKRGLWPVRIIEPKLEVLTKVKASHGCPLVRQSGLWGSVPQGPAAWWAFDVPGPRDPGRRLHPTATMLESLPATLKYTAGQREGGPGADMPKD